MKTNTKAILIAIGVTAVLIVGTLYYSHEPPLPPFGAKITEDEINKEIEKIKDKMENNKQPNGKYKRRDKELINGVEYEVHEYETPKGEIGYVIYMTKEDDDGIYKKVINSGPETYREKDWYTVLDKTIIDDTSSSTPQ